MLSTQILPDPEDSGLAAEIKLPNNLIQNRVDMLGSGQVIHCQPGDDKRFVYTHGLGPCVAAMVNCSLKTGGRIIGVSHLYAQGTDFIGAKRNSKKTKREIKEMVASGVFQPRKLISLLEDIKNCSAYQGEPIEIYFAGGEGTFYNQIYHQLYCEYIKSLENVKLKSVLFNPFNTPVTEISSIVLSLTAGITSDGTPVVQKTRDFCFECRKGKGLTEKSARMLPVIPKDQYMKLCDRLTTQLCEHSQLQQSSDLREVEAILINELGIADEELRNKLIYPNMRYSTEETETVKLLLKTKIVQKHIKENLSSFIIAASNLTFSFDLATILNLLPTDQRWELIQELGTKNIKCIVKCAQALGDVLVNLNVDQQDQVVTQLGSEFITSLITDGSYIKALCRPEISRKLVTKLMGLLRKDQLNAFIDHDFFIVLILKSIEQDRIVTFITQDLYEARIKNLDLNIGNINKILKLLPDSHVSFYIVNIIGIEKFVKLITDGDVITHLLQGISKNSQMYILNEVLTADLIRALIKKNIWHLKKIVQSLHDSLQLDFLKNIFGKSYVEFFFTTENEHECSYNFVNLYEAISKHNREFFIRDIIGYDLFNKIAMKMTKEEQATFQLLSLPKGKNQSEMVVREESFYAKTDLTLFNPNVADNDAVKPTLSLVTNPKNQSEIPQFICGTRLSKRKLSDS